MAEIKAFKAMRFNTEKAGKIEELTCPPYDIISPAQREEYIGTNPCNIIRLELPNGSEPYKKAGELLEKWEKDGILKKDNSPAIYIYEEEFSVKAETKKLKGFICRVKLQEFSEGVVLPHENTLSRAKEDRFELMKATGCNFSQVYSLYIDEKHSTLEKIDRLSSGKPNIEMNDGEITHRLWIVNDPVVIASVCEDFKDRQLYIADGHHRYETALNFKKYCHENNLQRNGDECDYIMMMLVDMQHEGLVVFPTHRLLHGLSDFNPEKLLERCGEYFEITTQNDPQSIEACLEKLYNENKTAFAFYCGGKTWNLLILKDENIMDDILKDEAFAVRHLDVSVLHSLILEKLLGIDKENMANQKNLSYTRSFDEAVSEVESKNSQAAFFLNSTRVSQIRDVAAAGEKMPQKSTYFYPKLITGLVMNQMDIDLIK